MKMDTIFKITVEDLENNHAEMETEKKISLSYTEYRGAVKLINTMIDALNDFDIEPEALQMVGFELNIDEDSKKDYDLLKDYATNMSSEITELKHSAELNMSNQEYDKMMTPVVNSAMAMKEFKFGWCNGNSDLFVAMMHILHSLIYGVPLTPLENKENEWIKLPKSNQFYHTRFPKLHKITDTVFYDDVRFEFYDVLRKQYYTGGFIPQRVNALFPIAFPYTPSSIPIKIKSKSFSTSGTVANNVNTLDIISADFPNGKHVSINEKYKIVDGKYIKIDNTEYKSRVKEYKNNRSLLKKELEDETDEN